MDITKKLSNLLEIQIVENQFKLYTIKYYIIWLVK